MSSSESNPVCCFCGETLPFEDAVEMAFSAPENREAVQTVWAHARCLAERLHSDVPLLPDISDRAGLGLNGSGDAGGPDSQKTVFLLHHVHEWEDGHEEVKLIGVYSSHALAEAALHSVRGQPGFKDVPSGFEINEQGLDRTGWQEGCVTLQSPGE